MRFEFTVRGPAGSRDVAVTAAADTPLHAVLPELRQLAGADPDAPVFVAGRRLHGDDAIGDSGLRDAVLVGVGGVAQSRPVAELNAVHVVSGAASSTVALRRDGLTVGRDPECDVALRDERVSRQHAQLINGPLGVSVYDLGSTNGTSIDGTDVGAGTLVAAGSLVRVGDSLLAVRTTDATPRAAVTPGPHGSLRLHRAPPDAPRPPATVIDAAPAQSMTRPGRVQWLAALLPAAAGAVLAWATATPMFLLFALLSPVMLLSGAAGDRLHWRRQRRRDRADSMRRESALAARIAAELASETLARRAELPDPALLHDIACRPGRRLWQRRRGDAPVVRLGSGDLPARTQLRESGALCAAGTVPSVPRALDLGAGPLGITGPSEWTRGVARWLVAQLAVLHAPGDLDLVVLGATRSWQWCRWLPQLRRSTDDQAALALLATTVERRRATEAERSGRWSGPWTMVVVDAADEPTSDLHASVAGLLEDGAAYGVTGIWLAGAGYAPPAVCRTVMSPDGTTECRTVVADAGEETVLLTEQVTPQWADEVARALAPFADRGENDLPARCRLGDLIAGADATEGVGAVGRAWAATDGGARTVVGLSGDGPVVVDLVADGPHALVVGTTGSGKSELLRSLVAGLALGYPPDELAFLLVDYKGGAAFADAMRLPHTTGVVTDLDAAATGRALRSLQAELRRRERLFAAVGADDLAGYRSRCGAGEQVTRLVIVVDEFAELAADQPQFVTGLVATARRGRSLGVHLVLATQRPGAAVTPDIRANTALRIALRVTEPVESVDVLGVPDAALVSPAAPGRGFARLGDRVVRLQTAQVTPDPDLAGPTVRPLGPWLRPMPDPAPEPDAIGELARLVDTVARSAIGIERPRRPWLPPLPVALPLAELDGPATGPRSATPIGRLDLPDEQSQPTLDLAAGSSLLIVGRARSGRTTALVTVAVATATRCPPARLQVHAIDADGGLRSALSGLPQLGTLAGPGDGLVPRLLARLANRARGTPVRTLLLIDDWDAVLTAGGDTAGARWTDALGELLRSGGDDLTVVVTGGRSLLLPRTAAAFGTRLLLALDDAADYGLTGVASAAVPAEPPEPGGGIRVPDAVPFRLAHPGSAPSQVAIREAVRETAACWSGEPASAALRLRPLPVRVGLAEVRAAARNSIGLLLGVAGDEAQPCALDLVGYRGRLLVAGPARSGRSSALLALALEARRHGHDVVVWAPARSPACKPALAAGARLLTALAGHPPSRPTLLVVDDVEACDDETAESLARWLRDDSAPLAAVVAGRSDELATSYRSLVSAVRRDRCGLLLRPAPIDGDLVGVRLPNALGPVPAGRGVLVVDPRWLTGGVGGGGGGGDDVVPIQVAQP